MKTYGIWTSEAWVRSADAVWQIVYSLAAARALANDLAERGPAHWSVLEIGDNGYPTGEPITQGAKET